MLRLKANICLRELGKCIFCAPFKLNVSRVLVEAILLRVAETHCLSVPCSLEILELLYE